MTNTLILLRGLGRGKHHWGSFANTLQASFPDIKIVAIDLAGNGDRFLEKSPDTIEAAVADIRQQLQNYQITPPCHVVGLSLGGMIALEWMQFFPHELDKVIVINTSHGGDSLPWQRMRPSAMMKLFFSIMLPVAFRERIILGITANNQVNPETTSMWINLGKQQPVSLMNLIRQIQVARSFHLPLSCPASNLLVLASIYDKMVNVTCSKKIAENLDADLLLHPFASHEITLDDPQWVIQSLKL